MTNPAAASTQTDSPTPNASSDTAYANAPTEASSRRLTWSAATVTARPTIPPTAGITRTSETWPYPSRRSRRTDSNTPEGKKPSHSSARAESISAATSPRGKRIASGIARTSARRQ
jgi:hypothetical protein